MFKEIESRNEFNEIVKEEKLTVVDFFATWCGPCRMLAPELHELESEHPEINVVKVDVDKLPELAGIYYINAVPTLIFFKNGKVINQVSGYMDKDSLEEIVLNLK
ncbi:MAG: thioredoxin [Candidatus Onthovivens sp.]|nr:thioredoxin [Candidatus Onthovivens sp.]